MENGSMRLGRTGERLACGYLVEHGHTVVETNWRYSHKEIDIITLDACGLHFVEVKSRIRRDIDPIANVTGTKMKNMADAAKAYLNRQGPKKIPADLEIHFDIVTLAFEGEKVDIRFYPDAFFPIYTH